MSSLANFPEALPTPKPAETPVPSEQIHDDGEETVETAAKKKKKKKSKKAKAAEPTVTSPPVVETKPPVLCISRNKHWKYISSYHGPWLQLPLELLESLLTLNMDPVNFSPRDERIPYQQNSRRMIQPTPTLNNGTAKPIPPPIDPGVFRSVASIRRLIDEASDLAVRAASGLSSAQLGNTFPRGGGNGSWSTAQALGLDGFGDRGGGRNVAMSATRTHRIRSLAVQKLAAAYKADEIAASVMVMQGASSLDDIAERVLKVDPHDADARYVHFFHEKIPSRQLAESTSTDLLDQLIQEHPQKLEYWRTRGIVRCFREEYSLAIRDFTHAFKESRAIRKARIAHKMEPEHKTKGSKGRKKNTGKSNGQAPVNGTSVPESYPGNAESAASGEVVLHASVTGDAPDPIEPQVLFLRAAAYLQNAISLVEGSILKVEGVPRVAAHDAVELKLSLMERGRHGGVVLGDPNGPLGSKEGARFQAYRAALAECDFREQITALLKKCIRDHEKFMTYFDTVDGQLPTFDGDQAQRIESAFMLSESLRPGSQSPSPPLPENPGIFTTYHPLLVESHFSVLICHLMLGDFVALLPAYERTAALVDGLEGYPVFLPARSMAQAEFVEILERLAGGWKIGTQPHSLSSKRLAIEDVPRPLDKAKIQDDAKSSSSPSDSGTRAGSPDGEIKKNRGKTKEAMNGTRTPTSLANLDWKGKGRSIPTYHYSSYHNADIDTPTPTTTSFTIPPIPSDQETNKRGQSSANTALSAETEEPSTSLTSASLAPSPDDDRRSKLAQHLDYCRMLLHPVLKRQRFRADQERVEAERDKELVLANGAKSKKKPLSINIPLHGPRVDLVLAYLGAVHLPELEDPTFK